MSTRAKWFSLAPGATRPDGEIGRRSGLKIRGPQGCGGSSPPPGTIESISYAGTSSHETGNNVLVPVLVPVRS